MVKTTKVMVPPLLDRARNYGTRSGVTTVVTWFIVVVVLVVVLCRWAGQTLGAMVHNMFYVLRPEVDSSTLNMSMRVVDLVRENVKVVMVEMVRKTSSAPWWF